MNTTLPSIEELLRMPAPCPSPFTLACDGPNLWVGSNETCRIYGVDAQHGTVFEEARIPGKPFGGVVTGKSLRVIVGDADDNRKIRRYVFGKDFKTEAIPCPNDTGSFLGYDGDCLFVSQRFDKQIVEIDESGTTLRTIPTPREVTGMTIVGGIFYLVTVDTDRADDYRLLRMDARHDVPETIELAAIPFPARSLAFDGTRFWTNWRAENAIIAFAKPD